MFHTISKISKKANLLPITITKDIRSLPPIKSVAASTLWEEMSEDFIGETIISHMRGLGEDLAIDLHRFNEEEIEKLSGGLWVNWKKARETLENIRRGIRGTKKDVMSQRTKEDYKGDMREYRRVLEQHGSLPVKKVGVEYSGGSYSNEELLSYYEDNKSAISKIDSVLGTSFEAFVENFLARLSSTPRLTKKHKGKILGVSVPLSLLEVVQDDIDFETYDLSEDISQSGLSAKQMKELQVKYDDALRMVLIGEEDSIKDDMRGFIGSSIQEKEKGTVYNKNGLALKENLNSYHQLKYDRSSFNSLYESLGGVDFLRKSIESEFGGTDFDVQMVDEEKLKNGLRQIADALFSEVKSEKRTKALAQLKVQIEHINSVWKSNHKLSRLLYILNNNKATTKDVKDYVGRFDLKPADMKAFYDEILDRVNVEGYLKSSFSYNTRITRTAPEKSTTYIREYMFKKSGRAKLNTEIDRILESHSAFSTVSSRAKAYVKLKIKEGYAKANGIDVDQIEG